MPELSLLMWVLYARVEYVTASSTCVSLVSMSAPSSSDLTLFLLYEGQNLFPQIEVLGQSVREHVDVGVGEGDI